MDHRPRILLVDDMKLLLRDYAIDFSECDIDMIPAHYAPDEATNAEHGTFRTTRDIVDYALAAKPPFDAVLSDVDCNGDQFGKRLAGELLASGYPQPILMFSQAPGEYLEDQLWDMGIKTLWEKPHSFEMVQTMAENIRSIVAQQTPATTVTTIEKTKPRLVLFDDDPQQLNHYAKAFEGHGYAVTAIYVPHNEEEARHYMAGVVTEDGIEASDANPDEKRALFQLMRRQEKVPVARGVRDAERLLKALRPDYVLSDGTMRNPDFGVTPPLMGTDVMGVARRAVPQAQRAIHTAGERSHAALREAENDGYALMAKPEGVMFANFSKPVPDYFMENRARER